MEGIKNEMNQKGCRWAMMPYQKRTIQFTYGNIFSLFRQRSPTLYQWELPVLAVFETFNVNFFFPSAPGRFLPCR